MSTVYVCQGKQCPLRATNPSGLAIIPTDKPRYRLALKEVLSGSASADIDLCQDCAWTIREMVAG